MSALFKMPRAASHSPASIFALASASGEMAAALPAANNTGGLGASGAGAAAVGAGARATVTGAAFGSAGRVVGAAAGTGVADASVTGA